MKVRVKEGCTGFFNGIYRKEGDVFTIEAKNHSSKQNAKGDPAVISVKGQFSSNWMEELREPKPKSRPQTESD